jgi:hypothetical protein
MPTGSQFACRTGSGRVADTKTSSALLGRS